MSETPLGWRELQSAQAGAVLPAQGCRHPVLLGNDELGKLPVLVVFAIRLGLLHPKVIRLLSNALVKSLFVVHGTSHTCLTVVGFCWFQPMECLSVYVVQRTLELLPLRPKTTPAVQPETILSAAVARLTVGN
jgi:hypothetical protein